MLHPLLLRHLKRAELSAETPPSDPQVWTKFLQCVHRAYTESDESRYLLERSLAVSSEEMQQLHRRLEGEAARLESIVESVGEGLCAVDESGTVTMMNTAARRLLGLAALPTGATLKSLATLRDGQGHAVDWAEARAEPLTGEGTLLQPEGSTVPVQYFIGPLTAQAGARGVVVVLADISERKQAALAQQRAREAAEAASRAKTEFLANVSHEIRTPMTAILGYADLLLDQDVAAADQKNFLNTIRSNGEHLLAILNDILDISKIEAGKMNVELVECSPSQIVEDVASLMRAKAVDRRLDFRVEYSGPIPALVRTDPVRVRQILANLVGNAIKFTERGGVRVVVRGEEAAPKPGAARVQFQVIDTGIGLSEEGLRALFQPFVQADTSHTRRFGGTGLGLSISKRLANMLGGDISVSSSLGVGTTFVLTLDLLLAAAPVVEPAPVPPQAAPVCVATPARATAPSSPPVAAPATGSSLPLSGARILLAEDGVDNQRLISLILRKAGAEVEIAENGLIACAKLGDATNRGQPFDVVLMDMQMPELDGYGATSRLRSEGCTLPIIALTAHAMASDRDKCLAAGCSEYATKPVDRSRLIGLIQTFLTRSPETAELTAPPPSSSSAEQPEADAGRDAVPAAVVEPCCAPTA